MQQPTPEEELAEFERQIARAMTTWGLVEIALCMLFSTLLYRHEFNRIANNVFYAIENFRAKLQAIDAAANIALNSEGLDKWKAIEKHAKKRAAKRNRIAHHERLRTPDAPPNRRYALIEPMLAADGRGGATNPMYLHDIREATDEFRALGTEIRNFINFLQGRPPE